MAYDKKDFERVGDLADIVQEIGSRIELKKVGSNYQGCCPFHSEKTPSFTVSPTKKIWKCFGCGESGDVIAFVAKHESISQVAAMRKLAGSYGIEVSSNHKEEEDGATDKQEAYTALKIAQIVFESALLHNVAAKRYIVSRGISNIDIVKTWGIGYAASDYRVEASEIGMNLSGLKKDGRWFFRNRIMFPIEDISGRVIGFGGRREEGGKSKAKYINSQETPLYNKSSVLYGIRQALPHIRKTKTVIITEGYFDVIMLHQVPGLNKAVAPCGTALTVSQAAILAKYANTAVIMFDGDAAGLKATANAIESLIQAGFKDIEITLFPDGCDAADMAVDSGFDLSTFIDNVKQISAIDFLLDKIVGDSEEKCKVLLDIISKCPSPLRRDDYIRIIAENTTYSQNSLTEELNIILKRRAYS